MPELHVGAVADARVRSKKSEGPTDDRQKQDTGSIVRALDAGVGFVEHASFATASGICRFDAAIASRMRAEVVGVCPTVAAGVLSARAIRLTGASENSLDHNAIARLEARRAHTAHFRDAGVPLLAGSDCGVTNTPFGSATLRLSADSSKALLNFSHSGLSSPVTGEHIDNEPYLGGPSLILYDISATSPQPDGSYLWNIGPVGAFSASDVIKILMHEHQVVDALADSGHYDLVIYGHTHEPDIRKRGNTLIVNPGELSGWLYGRSTMAVADLSSLSAELIEL